MAHRGGGLLLAGLRQERGVDFVTANGENVAGGMGLTMLGRVSGLALLGAATGLVHQRVAQLLVDPHRGPVAALRRRAHRGSSL